MENKVYNQKAEETGKIKLPEEIFDLPWNPELVHQVFVSMISNKRQPIAHAKGRGEVRGGGKKPWQQKGTGRARHGSSRSPIWIGGGVTHGPSKERNYNKKINQKMKKKAFLVALSQKLRDNELLFLDKINLKNAKTKEAAGVLKSLSTIKGFEKLATKRKNAVAIAYPKKDETLERGFNNIAKIATGELKNLNLLDTLTYKYLILTDPKETLKTLQAKTGK